MRRGVSMSVSLLGLIFFMMLLICSPIEAKLKGASIVDNDRRLYFGEAKTSPPVVGDTKATKMDKKVAKKKSPPSSDETSTNPGIVKSVAQWLLEPFGGVGGVFQWGLRVLFGEP